MEIEEYSSSWEYTKDRSTYHFDKTRQDTPGEWYHVIGRFNKAWHNDLESIKQSARPMTWENRKYTINREGPVSHMLAQEEYDIAIGGGNPKMAVVDVVDKFEQYPSIVKLIDFFGLEGAKSRLHVQRTGQVFNRHIDKLDDLYPGEPWNRIIRFAIMLEDWEPGHFYQYGNDVYDRWTAGDVHWFDWPNVPHATANASSYPRYTLQVTGLKTARTEEILSNTYFQNFVI